MTILIRVLEVGSDRVWPVLLCKEVALHFAVMTSRLLHMTVHSPSAFVFELRAEAAPHSPDIHITHLSWASLPLWGLSSQALG